MSGFHKKVLLIGDTFVSNLLSKKNRVGTSVPRNSVRQFSPSDGFEDSYFQVLREDFHDVELADEIELLLQDSVNPAVLHLASVLDREDIACDFIHCSLMHRDRLVELLQEGTYEMIGISTTFTMDRAYIADLVSLIRNYIPDSNILLGGMYIVKLFKRLQNEQLQEELSYLNADYYIFTDVGEQSMLDIINYEVRHEGEVGAIANIAWMNDSGYVINPSVDVDLNVSYSNWRLSSGTRYAFLRTATSCLFKCKFCDYHVVASNHKSKSLEIVREELQSIKAAGIQYIRFLDDTFNIPRRHFHDIVEEMARGNYGFGWVAYLRCQYLDEETACLMKESGCMGVFLGFESGNNDILKKMNKRSTVEKYQEGVSWLHQYDIPIYGVFIVGFPGETDESIEDTIQFIRKAKPQYYRLFRWSYNPQSPIASEAEQHSLEGVMGQWRHETMTSEEADEKCVSIWKSLKDSDSIHCTIPFDYTFYLNHEERTKNRFNDSLKRFNQLVSAPGNAGE